MIDLPHNFTEKWLTAVTDWAKDTRADLAEIFGAGWEVAGKWFKKYIEFTVILIAAVIIWLCCIGYNELFTPKNVTVVTDDGYGVITETHQTIRRRVDSFMADHDNFKYDETADYIDCEIYTPIKDGMTINIIKSFNVYLVADGVTYTYNTLGITTQELLDKFGITIGYYDVIDTPLDEDLHALQTVTVDRITMDFTKEHTEIPFKTLMVEDKKMTIGKTEVTTTGRKGINETNYLCVYKNGDLVSKNELDTILVQEKIDQVVSYGTKILKGIPEEVKRSALEVLTNVKAVSYYFDGHPYGVYGLDCTYGTVAVDRKVIPLGSKLYIEGYGYAIANDVGSGIKGKKIDLYMEKRSQCSTWGARRVKVYILSYGDNKRYWER